MDRKGDKAVHFVSGGEDALPEGQSVLQKVDWTRRLAVISVGKCKVVMITIIIPPSSQKHNQYILEKRMSLIQTWLILQA